MLDRWAQRQGLTLNLGEDERPAAPTKLSLEYAPASELPAFRFVVAFRHEGGLRLKIEPYGFSGLGLERLLAGSRVVVGEVHAVDNSHASVRFAYGNESDRDSSKSLLLDWAAMDRWHLEFEAATYPLTETGLAAVTHSGTGRCGTCYSEFSTGFASHQAFGFAGWQATGCRVCGGRLSWADDFGGSVG